jgi:hypothetical protein
MNEKPKDLSGQINERGKITLEHIRTGKLSEFFPVDAREAVSLGFWQLPGGEAMPEVEKPKPKMEPDKMFVPGQGDPKPVSAFTTGPDRVDLKAKSMHGQGRNRRTSS